jgi:hypothetical protein
MNADRGENQIRPRSILAAGNGDWVMPPVSYVDPTRRFCEFCGRPIARKFWRAKTERGVGIFCHPAHAALYATYPVSAVSNDD